DLPDYMVKRVGDRIQQGDVLAETKAFIRWFKTQVRAPTTGTVETVSTATGQVILREPPRPGELFAYLDGTVSEVLPGQGVRVDTTCAFIQGIFGIGDETWGSLVLGGAAPEEDVTAAHFTCAHARRSVVGRAVVARRTGSGHRDRPGGGGEGWSQGGGPGPRHPGALLRTDRPGRGLAVRLADDSHGKPRPRDGGPVHRRLAGGDPAGERRGDRGLRRKGVDGGPRGGLYRGRSWWVHECDKPAVQCTQGGSDEQSKSDRDSLSDGVRGGRPSPAAESSR